MPAPSHNSGDDIVQSLVADKSHDSAVDEPMLYFAAVTDGPEIANIGKKRKGLGVGAWLSIIWLALLLTSSFAAPFLPIPDPINDVELPRSGGGKAVVIATPPSLDHLFGLDGSGHDVLSRVIWGARNSLLIGIVSVGLGLLVGGVLGNIAGYFKGKIGGFIGSVLDILLAFPQLILALFVVTVLGHTVANVTFALAIVSTPVLARIARASALSWSEREFVLAARAQGATHRRVIWREVLPNVLPAMFSIALLGIAVVIVAEAGLAIIGAGVKPEVVTWGNIIVGGQGELRGAAHIVLAPSLIIFLTVLSLNFLGDVVRARSDVRDSAL
ncbi:MAG: ABC transporter permease [Acidimicrobiia bacterium]|nr:ABC transporter permease [Acidimicrobiia bacterium]